MKILALMTLDIFRLSLGTALQKLGHNVRFLESFSAASLNSTILEFKPDMVIDMGWDVWSQDLHYQGELHTIHEVIKRHRVFHLYFAEEDWLHYDRWSKRYCEIMKPDFVLTRSPLTIRYYEAMGIPATYLDVGCNPDFHKPSPYNAQYGCDVAVVATGNFTLGEIRYKSIHDLVIPLFESNLDVRIWGRDWENTDWCYPGKTAPSRMLQGKLPFPETPSVYSSAKISISIQTCNDQLSNRTLDIMSSGGFLLTSNTKAVREKLRPGVNCVVSNSPEETIHWVNYYLQHEAERKRIADQGLVDARERFAYQKTLPIVWPEIISAWTAFQKGISRLNLNNLFVNGSFKNKQDAALICFNAEQNLSYGHNGSYSFVFQGGETNAYIQQNIPVLANKTYMLSAWFAKDGDGEGAPINILVQYMTSDHRLLGFGLYHCLFASDMNNVRKNEWIHYRGITTIAPKDAAYALILINKLSAKNSMPILITDCTFKETFI